MTPYQWFTVWWMVGMSLLIPLGLWLWRSGWFVGGLERRLTECEQKTEDLTARIETAVAARIAEERKKADLVQVAAAEARFDYQFKFFQERLTEIMNRMDKRFDDGSARMSDLNSKITALVDSMRTEVSAVKERLARLEPHQRRATDT